MSNMLYSRQDDFRLDYREHYTIGAKTQATGLVCPARNAPGLASNPLRQAHSVVSPARVETWGNRSNE